MFSTCFNKTVKFISYIRQKQDWQILFILSLFGINTFIYKLWFRGIILQQFDELAAEIHGNLMKHFTFKETRGHQSKIQNV